MADPKFDFDLFARDIFGAGQMQRRIERMWCARSGDLVIVNIPSEAALTTAFGVIQEVIRDVGRGAPWEDRVQVRLLAPGPNGAEVVTTLRSVTFVDDPIAALAALEQQKKP